MIERLSAMRVGQVRIFLEFVPGLALGALLEHRTRSAYFFVGFLCVCVDWRG